MAKRKSGKQPFQPPGISAEHAAHREFVLDRASRIDSMMKKLKASPTQRKNFHKDPNKVAEKFGITLTDEEALGISMLENVPLDNIAERLKLSQVSFFNANCKCGMRGFGSGIPV